MPLADVYDPDRFRERAQRVVELLAGHLARATKGGDDPVVPWQAPAERVRTWTSPAGDVPRAEADVALARVLAESTRLHHPRCVGHQVAPPIPTAVLGEAVSALLNNGMAIYEMGPAATAIERDVVRWMATKLGLGREADGFLTSGGSLGNLTALLAARQAKAGHDAWEDGTHGGEPLALLVSDHAHYSIDRTVRILGWGADGVVRAPADPDFRLRASALEVALRVARERGRRPIAVVANAGSTATGTFDPLEEIATFCEAHDLWLHVDAAHGASAALSPAHRALVAGIERADSIVWDAHKLLWMPALATGVLFRDGRRSFETFAQDAAYLLREEAREAWWDLGHRTFECTKRMMALPLWLTLAVHGEETLREAVERTFALAHAFASCVEEAADFELAREPEANIVCFRHVPAGRTRDDDLDGLQARIRAAVVESGAFYLVQTWLPDGLYLRTTIMNPLTSRDDLTGLLHALRRAAADEVRR